MWYGNISAPAFRQEYHCGTTVIVELLDVVNSLHFRNQQSASKLKGARLLWIWWHWNPFAVFWVGWGGVGAGGIIPPATCCCEPIQLDAAPQLFFCYPSVGICYSDQLHLSKISLIDSHCWSVYHGIICCFMLYNIVHYCLQFDFHLVDKKI